MGAFVIFDTKVFTTPDSPCLSEMSVRSGEILRVFVLLVVEVGAGFAGVDEAAIAIAGDKTTTPLQSKSGSTPRSMFFITTVFPINYYSYSTRRSLYCQRIVDALFTPVKMHAALPIFHDSAVAYTMFANC
jgi:hypothetical protein